MLSENTVIFEMSIFDLQSQALLTLLTAMSLIIIVPHQKTVILPIELGRDFPSAQTLLEVESH